MPKLDWQKLREIFAQASEMPEEARIAFIEAATKDDPAMRKEVLALLNSNSEATSFLNKTIGFNVKNLTFTKDQAHPVADFPIGTQIGHFILLRLLGKGGFAKVYLARDSILEREVALKIAPVRGDEGKTMAMLEHENIVSVFSQSIDEARQLKLICMQFVEGQDLEQVLQDLRAGLPRLGKDSLSGLLDLGIKLATALAYAHDRGILHLDIKPANILVSRHGTPMLTDFNVSFKACDLEEEVPEMFGGTLDFMAPEHRRVFENSKAVRAIDRRTDLFSLGKVLQELVVFVDPSDRKGIQAIIEKCLKQNPDERFQDAKELAGTLQAELQLNQLSQALPEQNAITRTIGKYPFGALLVIVFLPNIFGSIFNIVYNSTEIVSKLTPEQRDLFESLLLGFNITAFVSLGALGLFLFREFFNVINKINESEKNFTAAQRKKVLRFPKQMGMFLTLCWAIGAFFWPGVLYFSKGGLSTNHVVHFVISFIISWLISMCIRRSAVQPVDSTY